MPNLLTRFTSDQHGAAAIEYGLLAALIFLAVIAGINATGVSLGDLYRAALDRVVAALN
jgi:pilus assembly protein Flp/PilA